MKTKKIKVPELKCPDCGSTEVTLTHEQMFMANSGEHYCHSVKIQDSDSKAWCIDCNWYGTHEFLKGYEE